MSPVQLSFLPAAEPAPEPKAPAVCPGCEKPAPRAPNGVHKACREKLERKSNPEGQDYHEIFAHYIAEFERVRGEKPIIQGKDRAAVKRAVELAAEIGVARVKQLITVGVQSRATISFIVSEPSRFQGTRGQRVQPQARKPQHDWRNAAPMRRAENEPDPWDLEGKGDDGTRDRG